MTRPTPPKPAIDAPPQRFSSALLALAAAGLLARLLVALLSLGSNDFVLYRQFADYYLREDLAALYRDQPDFNHTLLTTVYFVAARLGAAGSDHLFSIHLKLPVIAADIATAFLLWKIWNARTGKEGQGGRGAASLAVALFAWNLCSILVTGYHCNTDSLYASLTLLAAYLLQDRNKPFAAGLALAAAINIKLLPVLLLAPLALACRTRKQFLHFLAALALGALPFAYLLLRFGLTFLQKVVAYNSNVERWGINLFLLELRARVPAWTDAINTVGEAYHRWGGYLVLLLIVALSTLARRRNWSVYDICTRALALFIVLTPGWGLQYAVIIVPFLSAVSLRLAAAYGLSAGLYLASLYAHASTGAFPWLSFFQGLHPLPHALLGLLPWSLLLLYLSTPTRHADTPPNPTPAP